MEQAEVEVLEESNQRLRAAVETALMVADSVIAAGAEATELREIVAVLSDALQAPG